MERKPITKKYLNAYAALYGNGKPPAVAKPKKKRTYPELNLVHLPVMKWASTHPICKNLLIHIPNERKCSPRYGSLLKLMGVKRGVSDLLLVFPVHPWHGYWVELKAPGKRLTAEQWAWLELMHQQGYATGCFDHAHTAINAIEQYLSGCYR